MEKIPRGYVVFRKDALQLNVRQKLFERLRIVPLATSSFTEQPAPICMYVEEGDYIGVPRGFFHPFLKSKFVDEFKFVPCIGTNDLLPSNPIKYRAGQQEIVDEAYKTCIDFGGAIIESGVGTGKTIIGIETGRRLGHKMLVLVPTTVLADQWKKEVMRFYPTWRIGWLQADKIDIKDKDIVIGTLQSAALKDYPEFVYEDFGTVIFDEIHKVASKEFSKAMGRFGAKYLIAVSGTLKRADRADAVFIYGIGPIVASMGKVETMDPTVYFVDTQFVWSSVRGSALDRQKNFFLKDIISSPPRNDIIIKNVIKAVNAGRNVLVLSERVAHAEYLFALAKRALEGTAYSAGIMVGTSSQKERDLAQTASVIFATVQLVGTGFNEPRLDTLIFATPIQSIEQAVGRIRRLHPDKKNPLVLDLVDSQSKIGIVFARSRWKKYQQRGWNCNGTDVFNRRENVQ